MQIGQHAYTYDVAWRGTTLSVHVVETEEGTLLFGAGDETTVEEVVDIATSHDVDAVVAEHGDGDHYKGIPALDEALDLEVAVPAGDAHFLVEDGIEPDVRLGGGDRFLGVEAISTPGHTPDNMAYLDEEILVAGDTVVGADSRTAGDHHEDGALAVISARYNADNDRTRASVERLLDYEFDVVLVTHGSSVLENGFEEVERLVEALS